MNMKHDYRKKTNWKVDDQFEKWSQQAKVKSSITPKYPPNKRWLIVGLVIIAIITIIFVVKHHAPTPTKIVTEQPKTINIPLSLPSNS